MIDATSRRRGERRRSSDSTAGPIGSLCSRCRARYRAGESLDCPDCEEELGPVAEPTIASDAPVVQPKLSIGRPKDRYEREADRVADTVVRGSRPRSGTVDNRRGGSQQPSLLGQSCPTCEGDACRSTVDLGSGSVTGDLAREIEASRGGGRPLPASARSFFEPRFGQNFERVRIHDDVRATRLNDALDARAFTVGRDVYFGAEGFHPSTVEGRRLLAHELTHVVQQGEARTQREGAGDERPPAHHRSGTPDLQRWARAANCWHPRKPGNVIGMDAHKRIQELMVALGFLGEVRIPGAKADRGRADLLATDPPWLVPATAASTYPPAPAPILNPPSNPPTYASLGEIKPVTDLIEGKHGAAVTQLGEYMTHHDAYYNNALGPNQFPCRMVNPKLASGIPFIGWPPQSLMVLPPIQGVVYYNCRPTVELAPALEFIRQKTREILVEINRQLQQFREWLEEQIYEPVWEMILFSGKVQLMILYVLLCVALLAGLAYLLALGVASSPVTVAVLIAVVVGAGIAVPEALYPPSGAAATSVEGDDGLAGGHNLQPARELFAAALAWADQAGPDTVDPAAVDSVLASAPTVAATAISDLGTIDDVPLGETVAGLRTALASIQTLTSLGIGGGYPTGVGGGGPADDDGGSTGAGYGFGLG